MDKNRKRIERLNLKRTLYESATTEELAKFNAGKGFEGFNHYIQKTSKYGAIFDNEHGMGVTHLIWNELGENKRDLVAYFTLSATAVPYDDGNNETDEEKADLSNYPPINGIEIKMFAVDESYQNSFFESQGIDIPVSAWCLAYIVNYISDLSDTVLSIQAIFLHALENAEGFYDQNNFSYAPAATRPLYSADSDFKLMWMPLKPLPDVIQVKNDQG